MSEMKKKCLEGENNATIKLLHKKFPQILILSYNHLKQYRNHFLLWILCKNKGEI